MMVNQHIQKIFELLLSSSNLGLSFNIQLSIQVTHKASVPPINSILYKNMFFWCVKLTRVLA